MQGLSQMLQLFVFGLNLFLFVLKTQSNLLQFPGCLALRITLLLEQVLVLLYRLLHLLRFLRHISLLSPFFFYI